jgi:hypothetical protein
MIDGIPIRGWYGGVSMTDIRTAVAIDRAANEQPEEDTIYEILVVTDDRIRVYHTPRNDHLEIFRGIRRVGGRWRNEGIALATRGG